MIERYLDLCWEHPKRLLAVVMGLTVLLSLLTFGRLDFDADRESLFRSTAEEQRRQADFERRFGSWKDLVLVVDGGSPRQREEVVEELAGQLGRSPLVTGLRATVELPGVERIGLYFLTVDELREIDRTLSRYGPLLRKLSVDGWYGFLEYLRDAKPGVEADPQARARFDKVWEQAVSSRGAGALEHLFPRVDLPRRSYYIDGENRHLIFLHSADPIAVKEKVKEWSGSLAFPGRVVLTGQPLLQAEERRETIRDAGLSTLLAVIVVQLILMGGFREAARPRLAFLALGVGLLWSVAWAAVGVGTLNIITINFLAITIGLGVDFSIHILLRYAEESERLPDSRKAMARTLRTSGAENLVGAVATSLAFWALVLTDFLAVQQLGVITGVAVPLCFLSVVLLLPPLLFWRERRHPDASLPALASPNQGLATRAEQALRRRPRYWLTLQAFVIAILILIGSNVRFDYNLLNMQSATSEAVRYERDAGFNSLAAFVIADSPAQARELMDKLQRLPAVSEVQTVAELLPEDVEEKRALVRSIAARATAIGTPSFPAESEPDWERLASLLRALEPRTEQPDWARSLGESGPGPVEDVWRRMQAHLRDELARTVGRLSGQDPDFEIKRWKAEAPDLERLSNMDGTTLLRVRAAGSLWEREVLVEFLAQLESVTDRGLGPPFLIRNYLEQLRRSYFDAVRYAVLAIIVLLALYFRSPLPTLIALLPKVVGAVGMFAAMAWAGIDLNPANCMALPLTLGIGLVFGIHAVHRGLEEPDAVLVSGATGRAIALSALTTIASFGTLMAASHPGIFSLGFVMAAGVAANMLATYLLVPPLLVLFRARLG